MKFETDVRQMHVIRFELFEKPRTWEVHGAIKAFTPAGLRRQLQQLCALYSTTDEPHFDVRSHMVVEREGGPHSDALTTHPRSKHAYAEAGDPPQSASTNEHPANVPVSATPPISITLFPPAPPSSTIGQHVSVLKHKVGEMEAQYNKIEEEEKELAVRSDERREQLWQNLRSGNPLTSATPPHPASLKRKLEELESDYDGIEKERRNSWFIVVRGRRSSGWNCTQLSNSSHDMSTTSETL
ncbi:MAG: hypothetical protein Q9226_006221 [Calogaya cf. arnoldii]